MNPRPSLTAPIRTHGYVAARAIRVCHSRALYKHHVMPTTANTHDLIFLPQPALAPSHTSHEESRMFNKRNVTSQVASGTPSTSERSSYSAHASAPIDIPPLPNTLMTVEDIGGMHFVTIDCPDVRERQAAILQDSICNIADKQGGRVTIIMGKVANFSCAWINSLIAINSKCTSKGGKLTLTGVAQPAVHILKQMGLAKKFTIV